VQTIYLRAEGGRIPELKRIVLAHQNRVVMAETFQQGLAELFGGTAETEAPPALRTAAAATQGATSTSTATSRIADLIREANAAYERATNAQKNGDWATYGTAIKRVGELLDELRRAAGGN
jgi:uncharacterized membrane protein (UPF0182 family)